MIATVNGAMPTTKESAASSTTGLAPWTTDIPVLRPHLSPAERDQASRTSSTRRTPTPYDCTPRESHTSATRPTTR